MGKTNNEMGPSGKKRKILVIGGGTVFHLKPQLALSSPAYGGTAKRLGQLLYNRCLSDGSGPAIYEVELVLTKMADPLSTIETPGDVEDWLASAIGPDVAALLFDATMLDFKGVMYGDDMFPMAMGKHSNKIQTRKMTPKKRIDVGLYKTPKVVAGIKAVHPDVFLVGFRTTFGLSSSEQISETLLYLQDTAADMVLSRDARTGAAIIAVPAVPGPKPNEPLQGSPMQMVKPGEDEIEMLVEMFFDRMNK